MAMNMGGGVWLCIFLLRRVFLRISQASLSMILILGLYPTVVSLSRSFSTPLLMHTPDLDRREYVKMVFLS